MNDNEKATADEPSIRYFIQFCVSTVVVVWAVGGAHYDAAAGATLWGLYAAMQDAVESIRHEIRRKS